ncbi:hypothetical protein PZ897_10495 [Hoeflea sp. YIM 152468]|uniref:hypothetical protein n=1 Tax=Hoeflea sp. YIM 152468 TaxID=3031759 RepID=UPI0023DB3AF2|nr:hypothetical protein [Hoeflea sp. YIM 152468]MDF1608605.1 hypothetical protein [Hoeflea sp. YIM 152468]
MYRPLFFAQMSGVSQESAKTASSDSLKNNPRAICCAMPGTEILESRIQVFSIGTGALLLQHNARQASGLVARLVLPKGRG